MFKHPLEPLRTTVFPSTSQPPWNINLCYWNLLQWYNVHQWLTSLITILLHCPALFASLSSCTHALHFLIFFLLCSVRHVHSMHHSSSVYFNCCTLLLLHTWITFTNNNHNNLQQQQQPHLFSVWCIYRFCAPCACNVCNVSACSLHTKFLHLLSALRDHHRDSSSSLVV